MKHSTRSRSRNRQLQLDLTALGPAALEQIRAQLGEEHFQRLMRKAEKAARTGPRYKVGPKEQRTCDGVVFASIWEMRAYIWLKVNVAPGTLHLQPVFRLQDAFDFETKHHQAINYVADFLVGPPRLAINEPIHPGQIVIDAKGLHTREFRMKEKMFTERYQVKLHNPHTIKELAAIFEQQA